MTEATEFDDLEADQEDVAEDLTSADVRAVVSGTDWTTETIVSQLKRGNIELNPRFQRRDAWTRARKSRLIESLIVGLPIPQIVLAESKNKRGQFLVLDGKQRLLALLQFWGLGDGPNNGFGLSGLTLRKDLARRTFADLQTIGEYEEDLNALLNQSVRTVVIKNWKDSDFLHTVFLRLNTGSVALSPQELRQALIPGDFTNYIDEAAADSEALKVLLGLSEPDPRMRDVEILARYLAFHFFASVYPGRMKPFLDQSFEKFNKAWGSHQSRVWAAVAEFEAGVKALLEIFGDHLARKPGSRSFNRAIFDALIYYHSQPIVREAAEGKVEELRAAYLSLFKLDSGFLSAIESDTAGTPNTRARLQLWAERLTEVTGVELPAPPIPDKE